MKREIWIGTVELKYSAAETPDKVKRAFTTITTWASSYEEFSRKSKEMLDHYGWELLGVEEAAPLVEGLEFDPEVENMLQKTRENRGAVVYGTFHTYRKHEA